MNVPPSTSLKSRIDTADWRAAEDDLGRDGFAVLPALLTPRQCNVIAGYFFEEQRFRSRIVMERYAFGRGEYKYFSYPLTDVIGRLRQSLYPLPGAHRQPLAHGHEDQRALLRDPWRVPAGMPCRRTAAANAAPAAVPAQ